ncbi:MAG: 3-methyl-2-oxobutanoate hydroxymethyltransferase [Gemmatimonadota bacterium]|nr:3-methyl-2-oxobutanoate hydroxymethyltransferase [Gemmatimonadota bacterium]
MTDTAKIRRLAGLKAAGTPIVMVTAYDIVSARVAEAAGVDVVLVGDSGANVVLGYESTREVSVDELLVLSRAVRRGVSTPLLVCDLPFGSYEASNALAVETARRFRDVAGCDAVKIEGAGEIAERARAVVEAGIPVMGHVGLLPQHLEPGTPPRAQGRGVDEALAIARSARELEAAGCFSIVFEAIPAPVATAIARTLAIPSIGIGAGPDTDGQVLVFHDLVGLSRGRNARFVKRYADLFDPMVQAVQAFAADVRGGRYPEPSHAYPVDAGQLAAFLARLAAGE